MWGRNWCCLGICALALVFMLMGSLPFAAYCAPMLASVVLMPKSPAIMPVIRPMATVPICLRTPVGA